jgi:ParB family chromosome partitioning protein
MAEAAAGNPAGGRQPNQDACIGRPGRTDTEEAAMIRTIPLEKLMLAECNVRRNIDETTIAELAETIAAHGVLQNLTVRPAQKGRYEVIVGGRRLRALQKLAAEGRVDAGSAVPCTVRDVDEPTARELGIAENVTRAALNPVEEFEAFAAIEAAQVPAEDIARRFGVDVRHVRRRMKLGQLAEPIREALREGEITLNVAAAFTVGTLDQQLSAWAELSGRCPPRSHGRMERSYAPQPASHARR